MRHWTCSVAYWRCTVNFCWYLEKYILEHACALEDWHWAYINMWCEYRNFLWKNCTGCIVSLEVFETRRPHIYTWIGSMSWLGTKRNFFSRCSVVSLSKCLILAFEKLVLILLWLQSRGGVFFSVSNPALTISSVLFVPIGHLCWLQQPEQPASCRDILRAGCPAWML